MSKISFEDQYFHSAIELTEEDPEVKDIIRVLAGILISHTYRESSVIEALEEVAQDLKSEQ